MKKKLIILAVIAILSTAMYIVSGYPKINTVGCTMEAKICPDGSSVGRSGLSCEFAACPTTKPKQIITPSSTLNNKNQCPKTEWIDCMPGPDKTKSECNPQYLKWAKENCPNFKGVAY